MLKQLLVSAHQSFLTRLVHVLYNALVMEAVALEKSAAPMGVAILANLLQ